MSGIAGAIAILTLVIAIIGLALTLAILRLA